MFEWSPAERQEAGAGNEGQLENRRVNQAVGGAKLGRHKTSWCAGVCLKHHLIMKQSFRIVLCVLCGAAAQHWNIPPAASRLGDQAPDPPGGQVPAGRPDPRRSSTRTSETFTVRRYSDWLELILLGEKS